MGIGGMLGGFGVIAEGHAAGYRQQDAMEIVSVVDPSAERRHAAEAALPGVRTYPALDLALEWERPSFVDVCTPPVFHLPMMVECLSRDIDVLCEKPLVMNGQELAVLRSALAASAGRLYPCHNYKFAPAVQAMVGHFSVAVTHSASIRGIPIGVGAYPSAEVGSFATMDHTACT